MIVRLGIFQVSSVGVSLFAMLFIFVAQAAPVPTVIVSSGGLVNYANNTVLGAGHMLAIKAVAVDSTFDGRPFKYIEEALKLSLPFGAPDREANLSSIWKSTEGINKMDSGNYFGVQKWKLLQFYDLATMDNTKDDNNEDMDFIAKVLGTTKQTVEWFSNAMVTAKSGLYPVTNRNRLYPAIDHWNWIAKAHSILSKMTQEQQLSVNNHIDNISNLNYADVQALYDMFEVRPNMPNEHKLQAAEFFQVAEIKFRNHGSKNLGFSSTRVPVQIKSWTASDHPRKTAGRPVDALARNFIPATDSDHKDWPTLASIRIAKLQPSEQRKWRDLSRDITKGPSANDLYYFYEALGIDNWARDSNALKAEMARALCVRDLSYYDSSYYLARAPRPVVMVNTCRIEEKQRRLQRLFFIERWDALHEDRLLT